MTTIPPNSLIELEEVKTGLAAVRNQLFIHGGQGSGHHGHKGREGKVGGSSKEGTSKLGTRWWESEEELEDSEPFTPTEIRVFMKLEKAVGTSEFYDVYEFQENEDITPKMLDKKGRIQSGKGSIQVYKTNSQMEPSNCHQNSSLLVSQGKAKSIGTGFAFIKGDDLSQGVGVWVQHSWAYDSKGRILETTVARDMYFGVELKGKALKEFVETNMPYDS